MRNSGDYKRLSKIFRQFNPLIPKTIRIEGPQITGTPQFLFQRYPKFIFLFKNWNDIWHTRNSKKPPYSPTPTGRAILTKKACAEFVKSIALNDRRWKLHSEIRTFRTAAVFCL
ncbi:hypothetical protein AVEN_232082-1 [Araneus ventricosus]|uniref:Uncharacterized protein n=1 Tax=Araneus ventricosus TaxID=182803 RepID=A0A4Y2S855_ARAVE|nr:hypothetical protein AVEN_232082-1 [Araneus ventricosus]